MATFVAEVSRSGSWDTWEQAGSRSHFCTVTSWRQAGLQKKNPLQDVATWEEELKKHTNKKTHKFCRAGKCRANE